MNILPDKSEWPTKEPFMLPLKRVKVGRSRKAQRREPKEKVK